MWRYEAGERLAHEVAECPLEVAVDVVTGGL
jgi:hypothetical protein